MVFRGALKFLPILVASAIVLPSASVLAAPAVSAVYYPANMAPNAPYRLYAVVSSVNGISSCDLYIDGANRGAMAVRGVEAVSTSTFPDFGTYVALVKCADTDGDIGSGLPTPIEIQVPRSDTPTENGTGAPSNSNSPSPSGSLPASPFSPSTTGNPSSSPIPASSENSPANDSENLGSGPDLTAPPASGGALIKLVCPDGAAVDHPCKAVYYYGSDGKRHAFPNEKVYFTWYANFDGVQTISGEGMSEIPLGKNATYRPGVKMVKFTTVNDVYAVSKGGNLRWVKTEEVARGLYGDAWNKKIDDISDAFYSNYVFGASVSSANEYVVANELSATSSVDESL